MKNSHVRLKGIAAQNPRYAGLLLPAYQEAFCAVASYTYRSLLANECSQELSDLFDRIATDALRHFQILGELIVALGGDPVVYSQLHESSEAAPQELSGFSLMMLFLHDSIREEQAGVERYETLMGRTDDRVVRSVLFQIIREKQSHLHRMIAMS